MIMRYGWGESCVLFALQDKQNLADIIQMYHQAKARQHSVQSDGNSLTNYPEYILPFLVHALAHHSCPNIDECKDVKAFELIYRYIRTYLRSYTLTKSGSLCTGTTFFTTLPARHPPPHPPPRWVLNLQPHPLPTFMGGRRCQFELEFIGYFTFYIFLDEFLNTVSYEEVLYVMGAIIF